MKTFIKRTHGKIWRTLVGLPVSLVFLGLIWGLKGILFVIDKIGYLMLKEWTNFQKHLEGSSWLGSIAWFVLYLPFILLSLLTLFVILYPVWFILKLIYEVLGASNIKLLLWCEYRKALPSEKELVDKAVEAVRQKMQEQGMVNARLNAVFVNPDEFKPQ